MTKAEFRTMSRKCPWFFHDGEPRCKAQKLGHCQRKNCAVYFWVNELTHTHSLAHAISEQRI
jgi:hypothetical protein